MNCQSAPPGRFWLFVSEFAGNVVGDTFKHVSPQFSGFVVVVVGQSDVGILNSNAVNGQAVAVGIEYHFSDSTIFGSAIVGQGEAVAKVLAFVSVDNQFAFVVSVRLAILVY